MDHREIYPELLVECDIPNDRDAVHGAARWYLWGYAYGLTGAVSPSPPVFADRADVFYQGLRDGIADRASQS